MIVYFTTVNRTASINAGGEIVSVDWERKKILGARPITPIRFSGIDDNPRGGTRGGRGIHFGDGCVHVASYNSVVTFDRELNELQTRGHLAFANLHETCQRGGDLWISSTALDLAVCLDSDFNLKAQWSPRNDPVVASALGLSALDFDHVFKDESLQVNIINGEFNQTHLNAVSVQPDGRPLVLLNRHGAVIRLNPTELVIHSDSLKGAHNLLVRADGSIVVNNTVNRRVELFAADGTQTQSIDLTRFDVVRSVLSRNRVLRTKAWLARHGRPFSLWNSLFRTAASTRPVFVRGLAETLSGSLLVGISPASILELDTSTETIVSHFSYSDNCRVCVHGIALESSR